ncbi:MAG TPA: ABC transporter permease subunit [Candidatus Polarisedimenticolaceae bacterium]|nr:ABC transporter permease subunit [Candidatus Polarisedimenticolaceae bacterium]
MSSSASPLLLFARQERILAVRSRWTQTFAGVFAALSIAVAGSGYVLTGGYGVQDFGRSAVSLVQLVLLAVPLTSLLLGVMALSPDRGSLEIVFSLPVSRATILLGKLLGLWQALVAAQALGFGAAGLLIFWQAGEEGVAGFALVFLGSAALTGVFLGLAALLAAGDPGRRRARTLALALLLWVALVIVFDVALLGIAAYVPSGLASRALIVGVLLNPVDAVRTGTLLGIEGAAAFGAASLAFLRFTRGAPMAALLLGGSVVAWVLVPVLAAVARLRRADL